MIVVHGLVRAGRGEVVSSRAAFQSRLTMVNERGLLVSVLTDVQFWVPVLVLVGGLVLLGVIR